MIIAILQPCFIPWMGYFEQMQVADLFVYMDDVQYTRKDWRNSNVLLCSSGPKRVSVPVKKCPINTMLNEAIISTNDNWRCQLLNKIHNWYKTAPFYDEVYSLLRETIDQDFVKLVDLNYALNASIAKYIGITTPVDISSKVPRSTSDRQGRIIEIVNFYGADVLYDGKSAEDFIDVDLFERNGIEVIFQNYIHQPYEQLHVKDFSPYMSIIDVMMMRGKAAISCVTSSPLSEKLEK
jgi:hypothetical protein